MDNDTTAVIRPIKNINYGLKGQALYKILEQTKIEQSLLLKYTKTILTFMDDSELRCSGIIKQYICDLISKALEIPVDMTNVVLKFLFSEKLISIENEKLKLTPYGRLFLISDTISNTVDMIRYYWEKADWNELSGSEVYDKFLDMNSRRYTACLLYQIEDKIYNLEYIKEKYSDVDLIYLNNYFVTRDMLKCKGIIYVLKNIFHPLGLLYVNEEDSETNVRLSNAGKKIFEHYSFNMKEEYTELIDEAWECYDRGNFQESFDIAKNVISVSYNIPEIYNLIGCVYIKMKKYDYARKIFNLAIDICDDNIIDIPEDKGVNIDSYVSLYYNLGLCYFYMGDFINALHIFNQVRKTVPYTLENIEEIVTTIKRSIIIGSVHN